MSGARIAFVVGIILFSIGLPLFIAGHGPEGEENLGMIIPGAIAFSVGGFLVVGTLLVGLSRVYGINLGITPVSSDRSLIEGDTSSTNDQAEIAAKILKQEFQEQLMQKK